MTQPDPSPPARPARFRKKPVVIEAVQFDGTSSGLDAVREFIGIEPERTIRADGLIYIHIHTLEGGHTATPNDWIIKGVKGEFYPCKPDIFEVTYERVE